MVLSEYLNFVLLLSLLFYLTGLDIPNKILDLLLLSGRGGRGLQINSLAEISLKPVTSALDLDLDFNSKFDKIVSHESKFKIKDILSFVLRQIQFIYLFIHARVTALRVVRILITHMVSLVKSFSSLIRNSFRIAELNILPVGIIG